jgi:hypothetical protein
MTPMTHKPAAWEIRNLADSRTRAVPANRVTLRATGDGWSLLGPDGELVFSGIGRYARRECLEYARDHGVSTVFS